MKHLLPGCDSHVAIIFTFQRQRFICCNFRYGNGPELGVKLSQQYISDLLNRRNVMRVHFLRVTMQVAAIVQLPAGLKTFYVAVEQLCQLLANIVQWQQWPCPPLSCHRSEQMPSSEFRMQLVILATNTSMMIYGSFYIRARAFQYIYDHTDYFNQLMIIWILTADEQRYNPRKESESVGVSYIWPQNSCNSNAA